MDTLRSKPRRHPAARHPELEMQAPSTANSCPRSFGSARRRVLEVREHTNQDRFTESKLVLSYCGPTLPDPGRNKHIQNMADINSLTLRTSVQMHPLSKLELLLTCVHTCTRTSYCNRLADNNNKVVSRIATNSRVQVASWPCLFF